MTKADSTSSPPVLSSIIEPHLDPEGYLLDLSLWNEAIAHQLAQRENIQLTSKHMQILHLARKFQQAYEVSPATRPLAKYIQIHLSPEVSASIYLMQLFGGEAPAKRVCRLAGLPKPTNCL
ncbi:TusE/DsrC/DsvC family sulfur relay protein [Allopseudospirillum japonicum]|nr:TusE/DsrC/DsvC family sulfur relay protein [Allopseudospirillum japonicum]